LTAVTFGGDSICYDDRVRCRGSPRQRGLKGDVLMHLIRRFWCRVALSAAGLLALGAAAAVAPSPADAEDFHLLGNDELIALLDNGTLDLNNVVGSPDAIRHYLQPVTKIAEHGKVDVVMPQGYDVERGIWWVEDEEFCVLYEHITTVRKRCFAVAKAGDDLRFIELRYELPDHKVVRPHQWVQTARLGHPAVGTGVFHLLNDQELVTLFNGAHIRMQGRDSPREVVLHFDPVAKPGDQGTMGASKAIWWVEDEQVCVLGKVSIGERKRCFAVARDGDNFRVIETRWEQPGHAPERLHQWIPSAQIFRAIGG
jgi:hypothetical protein